MKIYAVKKGKLPGIYKTWSECSKMVSGFKGAEYKSFNTQVEAEDWMKIPQEKPTSESMTPFVDNHYVIAFTDGSFDGDRGICKAGAYIMLPDGEPLSDSFATDLPELVPLHNVAGECIAALASIFWAAGQGYEKIVIFHDYAGVSKWITGEWEAKNELIKRYRDAVDSYSKSIHIEFVKVKGHSNNKYNDMADKLAGEAVLGKDCFSKLGYSLAI